MNQDITNSDIYVKWMRVVGGKPRFEYTSKIPDIPFRPAGAGLKPGFIVPFKDKVVWRLPSTL